LLNEIAKAIRVNYPEIVLICYWWTSVTIAGVFSERATR
jgi:hypothetical protein